jgi:hypothetical protein
LGGDAMMTFIDSFKEHLPRIKIKIDEDYDSPLVRAATTPGRGFKYYGTHVWIVRTPSGRYAVDEYDGPKEWLTLIESELEKL